MASSTKNSRRLRWALLMALALHLLLAWRYAPNLRARVDQALASAPETVEKVVEISSPPPSPEPPRERWGLQTKLSGGSPEALPPPLPDGFFAKAAPLGAGRLSLSGSLAQAPARAPEPATKATAPVVPAVMRLPDVVAISPQARTPKPSSKPAAPPAPPITADQVAPRPQQAPPAAAPPLRLPPEDDPSLDVAITRAAETAERSARAPASRSPAPDLRQLLLQGPIAETTLPDPEPPKPRPTPLPEPSAITTYPLDAAPSLDRTRAAPDIGPADQAPNRAEYFARLTAQLKATNQRTLAESVRATSRVTVRMKFVVDRRGRVLDIYPVDAGTDEALVRRAADVVRASAPFPSIPEAMAQPKLELSFPVEVYR